MPTVSVIIPIWNDAAQLRAVLNVLTRIEGIHEIIVGDASDGPECASIGLETPPDGSNSIDCQASE